MKYYFSILLFMSLFVMQAQIVNIPDNSFKNALLNHNPVIDNNGDGEIQVYEAESVTYLFVNSNYISDLTGIEAFVNLISLNCYENQLTNLDISNILNLKYLKCHENNLTNLDVSNNLNLFNLLCDYNSLTSLDVSNNLNLSNLFCDSNSLTNLDVSNNLNLVELSCSSNNLISLDVSNNLNLDELSCGDNNITNIDISNNLNLHTLSCGANNLTNIDVSNNLNLQSLSCGANNLTNIDVSNNLSLTLLFCQENNLTNLDVSNNLNLHTLYCISNNLTNIDVSNNSSLERLFYDNNPNLVSVNQKNGALLLGYDSTYYGALNCPLIEYVCADDDELVQLTNYFTDNNMTVNVNSYCSFVPGGEFYTVEGSTILDADNNGCDINDQDFPNLKLNVSDGVSSGDFIGNTSGDYTISLQEGQYAITPDIENPAYFNISPTSITVDFPTDTSPFIQDFCITPNGAINDVEILVVPTTPARPGFDAKYIIVYKNKGNQEISGNFSFNFNDSVIDYVSASQLPITQSVGQLTWNYVNLLPFETRSVYLTLNVNSPMETPAVNNGDILNFSAIINPIVGDVLSFNNTFGLNQTVVGSYDPNDKTCLEGNTLTPEKVGEYLNYMIRFENTGTANAINVVVKDEIDPTMFDVSTLRTVTSSHPMITKIEGDTVEFIFENINLPFDDATNDGFVVFKIKTLDTLVLTDTIENDAEIYFDFNFPIITNNEITTVQNILSVNEYSINDTNVSIYPNPVKEKMTIKSENKFNTIRIYDLNGRLYKQVNLLSSKNEMQLNIQELSSGLYLVKLEGDNGNYIHKIVKQ